MKKLLAMLLCLAMLLPTLVACGGNNEDPQDTTGNTSTDPVKEVLPLLLENLSDYTIIYPETGMNADLNAEIRALRDAIKDKFDVKLEMKSDFINKKNPIEAREILIGRTNRPESTVGFEVAPRANDYAVQIVDEKLVVVASTPENLTKLLRDLVQAIKAIPDGTTAFFTPEMQTKTVGEYALDGVTINGYDLSGYTIVCSNSNSSISMAKQFIEKVLEKYQYALSYTIDQYVETPEKAILFGNTKFGLPEGIDGVADDQYYIGTSNGNFYVYATDAMVLYKAIDKVVAATPAAANNVVSLDQTDLIETPKDTSLTTMSFNLWVSSVNNDRAKHVVERINLVKPDTLGVQEASSDWVNRLKNALSSEYDYIGMGREPGGKGEHSGIFYRKDILKVIESGTKWMSDTPDTPSKYAGSTCYRIFTYAVFERLSDGKRFVHVNAHTEHTSDAICLAQLKVLVNFINTKYSNLPIVLTGDLNATESQASVQHVLNNGFENGAKIAFKTSNAATFSPGGSIIDFCLTSENDFIVFEYGVDSYKYSGEKDYQQANKDPSDHCPIYIKYDLR